MFLITNRVIWTFWTDKKITINSYWPDEWKKSSRLAQWWLADGIWEYVYIPVVMFYMKTWRFWIHVAYEILYVVVVVRYK